MNLCHFIPEEDGDEASILSPLTDGATYMPPLRPVEAGASSLITFPDSSADPFHENVISVAATCQAMQ